MRQKRRKYDPVRVAIVLLVAVALVCTGGLSIYGLVRSVGRKGGSVAKTTTTETAEADSLSSQQDSSEPKDEVRLTQLAALKENVELAFQDNSLKDLKEQINAYLTEHGYDQSKVSWAVQDLVTGETIESSNAKQNFTAASTYKLPLCVYYYEEIAAGRMNASEALEYTEAMREKEDDENLNQPIHRKYKVGDKIQIDELLEAALLYSDNIAGHMLYEHIGGYDKFKHIVAKYTDQPQTQEFFSETSNVINADYMMRLLNHVYTTPGVFNDLKYWLQNTGISTFLNRSVPGAYIQKIGNFNEVRNAVGIYNGNPPFTLSVYSCISKTDGMDILADLGQLCLNYFQSRYNDGFYSDYDMTKFYELNSQMSTPLDMIALRPGPNGQTLPDLTEEEQKRMDAQNKEELGEEDASSSEPSSAVSSQIPAASEQTPTPAPADPAVQTPAAADPAASQTPSAVPTDPAASQEPDAAGTVPQQAAPASDQPAADPSLSAA